MLSCLCGAASVIISQSSYQATKKFVARSRIPRRIGLTIESYVLGRHIQAQCSAGVMMDGIPPVTQSEPGFAVTLWLLELNAYIPF